MPRIDNNLCHDRLADALFREESSGRKFVKVAQQMWLTNDYQNAAQLARSGATCYGLV
jgi:hypothetical protein